MAIVKKTVFEGYDVSFVDPLEKDYECPVCLLAVRDPVQTPCGHSFCKICFNQISEYVNPLPAFWMFYGKIVFLDDKGGA